jgi:ABC-type Fe3+-hydroxamate transport system substrate-binding protein
LEKELNEAETGIFELEQLKKGIEEKLSNPAFYENAEQLAELNGEYQKANDKLDHFQQVWESLAEQLESIELELA